MNVEAAAGTGAGAEAAAKDVAQPVTRPADAPSPYNMQLFCMKGKAIPK